MLSLLVLTYSFGWYTNNQMAAPSQEFSPATGAAFVLWRSAKRLEPGQPSSSSYVVTVGA